MPNVHYLIPVAPSIDREWIARETGRWKRLSVKLVAGEAPQVLACADAAIVASGTATLEAALAETPMVVVYKVAWPTYCVVRPLIKIRNMGLVNIVAGRTIVPELLQWRAGGRAMARELLRLMENHEVRKEIKKALVQVRTQLGQPGASMRAAREVLSVLGSSRSGPREERKPLGN
jgi:lipid-A-disaccharide synthase